MPLEHMPTMVGGAPAPADDWFTKMGVPTPGRPLNPFQTNTVSPTYRTPSPGYGMVPVGGGYNMVPGYQGPMWPQNNPYFTSQANGQGGYNYGTNPSLIRNVVNAGQPAPWVAPPLPGQASPIAGQTQMPMMPGAPGMKSPMGGLHPATTPMGAPHLGAPPAAPAPAAPSTPQNPSSGFGANLSGNLSGIFNQIAGSPYTPVTPPNVGGTQAQQNIIAYNQYLWNLANQQNQQRFQQAAQALQGAGQTSITDATQLANNARANISQGNISAGLNNTTIGATQNMGVDRELGRQLQSINEGVGQQLVNLLASKTDQAPSAAALAQLMMQAASNPGYNPFNMGGGGGGGMGGYGADQSRNFGGYNPGSAGRGFGGSPPSATPPVGGSPYVPSPSPFNTTGPGTAPPVTNPSGPDLSGMILDPSSPAGWGINQPSPANPFPNLNLSGVTLDPTATDGWGAGSQNQPWPWPQNDPWASLMRMDNPFYTSRGY